MQVEAVLLFLGGLGGGEILVILLIVLLLFGAKKIPNLARSLGSGIREFKDATHGMRQELEKSVMEDEPPANPQTPAREVKPGRAAKKEDEPEDHFNPGNID
jgi:sec-independent protein translocase protein TatA